MSENTYDVYYIKQIVSFGGSIILDASKYDTASLKIIANECKTKGTNLILRNVKTKQVYDLKQLASFKCVTFDLT
ncbi:hypothetical protein [Paraclostridium tenue]|uniref:STAS domain-containing protein n=1 Tax=Paraclostridium tenue TaxID=1737 RepID=A0ABN1LXZ5_9FIRM